jgi:tetratricopeptide (TPR) repeat protein
MSETSNQDVSVANVVTTREMDRTTKWLLWAVFFVLLMLISMLVYAWLSGGFTVTSPRTSQENALSVTAQQIAKDPTNGSAYAVRAEVLYKVGRKAEAYQVLSQGEAAVKGKNPALLYILRTWTVLLNSDGKYAEAEKVGQKGMAASDDYLARQGAALAAKRVTAIGGNLQTQATVDMAIQLGQTYVGEKKYDKAIVLYNYALKLDPLAADVLTQRGNVYLAQGNKAKAKADFTEALKYLPNDPAAKSGLSQASK